MKSWITCALLAAGLAAGSAGAQTLRWASQGDPQTMDPHSQNELLTNSMNGQVYEGLVGRDRNLGLVPALATEWKQTGPLTWRFKLRPNVKFHDGSPFTAEDVVFSMNRAKEPTSQISVYANAVGTAVAIDPLTVEFRLPQVNPIFLQHIAAPLWIMSKSWSEKNKVTRPLDFKNKEESYASFNANGTGPYMLASRAPGIKTVYKRYPNWWGRFEGNVQQVVYTPIANDATRLAALVSGEIDFVVDPAPRDVPRLRSTPGVKIVDGPENRVLFIGMDQQRDELLYGSEKRRNPFKDVRVRRALYHAIDIETLKTKLMNGQSVPTGGITPSPLGSYNDPAIESRLPFDLAKARALLAEAGYANGFEVTLDCPNNRYVNDEEICLALAQMWAKVGVKLRVNAMPRAVYFPKLEKFDTSLYMLGWGGAITDAEVTITPVLRAPGEKGVGAFNYGRVKNDRFEELAKASSAEPDPKKREDLVKAALREYTQQAHLLPLHRQVIPWAARTNVDVVHRADNWLEFAWVTVK
ncbi:MULTISPECIES: ABC transporter substrate-binding protein [Rubrivivax]|uniref:ABC transporter substrate-binding protein n=1 Tax=Rubrivivax benzoatilyticus TaxID=316997 RepID=A0ABX0HXU5_9BURK|nr:MULTISPECIES: ABC transporter substrate-binding protein [Rubrivivax]EGJ10932.1 putative binding-dependent transport protein [Rubrivivax benzoatilyticus JA2 = ATCC BAA-35]MCD0423358.1 ABC transporter substrate-binding protein [Rubrivivax sp. JA1024]NHK99815.1 ABC transporter substrate-binding protein [Rubrivivax benzoatilyticus]NHL25688.1 ABC transporter substrate-binding protein [Rubrivivax benzoatilyticus]